MNECLLNLYKVKVSSVLEKNNKNINVISFRGYEKQTFCSAYFQDWAIMRASICPDQFSLTLGDCYYLSSSVRFYVAKLRLTSLNVRRINSNRGRNLTP